MSPERRYPLALDQTEVERYQLMAAAARQAEADLWEPAGIVAGARVADVGCGPGALLPALSAAVGPQGRVLAVDVDPQAVAAATALVATAGLGNVTVQQGRAEATGLAAGSLGVVLLRHVLAHNGGAEDAIVGHLATLLRPGGCLYLVDTDGTAIRVIPEAEHPDLVELQQRYLVLRAARGDDNAAGLRLAGRLVTAGLELVEFRGRYLIRELSPELRSPAWAAREAMVTAGLATAEDLGRGDRDPPGDLLRPDVHRHRPPSDLAQRSSAPGLALTDRHRQISRGCTDARRTRSRWARCGGRRSPRTSATISAPSPRRSCERWLSPIWIRSVKPNAAPSQATACRTSG